MGITSDLDGATTQDIYWSVRLGKLDADILLYGFELTVIRFCLEVGVQVMRQEHFWFAQKKRISKEEKEKPFNGQDSDAEQTQQVSFKQLIIVVVFLIGGLYAILPLETFSDLLLLLYTR
ncbi:hypothetical protein Dimus_011753 [Dionaea muscipula]